MALFLMRDQSGINSRILRRAVSTLEALIDRKHWTRCSKACYSQRGMYDKTSAQSAAHALHQPSVVRFCIRQARLVLLIGKDCATRQLHGQSCYASCIQQVTARPCALMPVGKRALGCYGRQGPAHHESVRYAHTVA